MQRGDQSCGSRLLTEKTRNNGQWTEARFRSFITSLLRSGTMRWGPKNSCIKNARTRRGYYKCEGCGEEVPASLPAPPGKKRRIKNILADHIHPIVDPKVGFTSWDDWINRAYVEADGYQALCNECHTAKTEQEKYIASLRRKNGDDVQ